MNTTQDEGGVVLVVDEEAAGLLALQEMLQECGYLMMTALTGAAAQQIVQQRQGEIEAVVLFANAALELEYLGRGNEARVSLA